MSKIVENLKDKTGNKKTRIAVFVSGSGSNLQAIIDNIENGNLNCEISYVIADRECFGLKRAENHGIKNVMLDKKLFGKNLSDEMNAILENDTEKTDYIVLAGYLSILSETFINKWNRKIINIHPSLLPKYGGKGMYGRFVHQAIIENKEKKSGVTIHYVNEVYDEGEKILVKELLLDENETVDSLENRIKELEKEAIVEAFKKLLD